MAHVSPAPPVWRYVAAVIVADVLLLMGYDLVRPTAQSLLLESFGVAGLPATWVAIALGTGLAVAAVNRLLNRVDIVRLYGASTAVCAAVLLVLWALSGVPEAAAPAALLLYVWKDIYIVVLLEQMWSFCNLVFDERQAARFYGLFTAMGSLGAIAGDAVVRLASQAVGSRTLVLVGAACTAAAAVAFQAGSRGVEARLASGGARLPRTDAGGLALVARSRYLQGVAGLVFVTQAVITLLDYQFNGALQRALPDLDARSAYLGSFYLAVNATALGVQLLLVPLLLTWLGGLRALMIPPVVIAAGLAASLMAPGLSAAAVVLVAAKGLDYSLTRAAKEVLYLPLGFEEKYKAKALIDMFVYRAAKGLTSAGLVAGASFVALFGVAPLAAGLVPAWLALLAIIARAAPRVGSPQQAPR